MGAITALAAILFGVAALFFTPPKTSSPLPPQGGSGIEWTIPGWFNYVLAATIVGAVAVYALWIYFRIKGDAEERRLAARQFEQERDELSSALENLRERMALPSLVELNRIMLDRYHQIATDQADQSFKSSRRAMAIGYASLVVALLAVLVLPGLETKVAAAGLGTVAATLSGFLSRTYLRVYDRSLEQLNNYFNQPLVNSYYLTAERLIQEYSGSSKDGLIDEFVKHVLANAGTFEREPGETRSASAPASRLRRRGKPAGQVIDVGRADKVLADE
jgi:hypothetical protein